MAIVQNGYTIYTSCPKDKKPCVANNTDEDDDEWHTKSQCRYGKWDCVKEDAPCGFRIRVVRKKKSSKAKSKRKCRCKK